MTDHIQLPPPDYTENVQGFVHDTQRHYYAEETMRVYAERLHAARVKTLPTQLMAGLQTEIDALRHQLQTLAELGDGSGDAQILRMGYAAARLEIESLNTQLQAAREEIKLRDAQEAAIGAGGAEPLRRRECLHKISEPAPAGEYPALPESELHAIDTAPEWEAIPHYEQVSDEHSDDTDVVNFYTSDQMRAYVDADRAMRAQAAPAAVAQSAIAEMRSMAARGAEATEHDLDRFVEMLTGAPTNLLDKSADAAVPTIDERAIAAAVCRLVAELPDRNSPEDFPEAMLVTSEELFDAVVSVIEQAVLVAAPATQELPATPPKAITAMVMQDDGGPHPAYCLMVAYRTKKDAMDALAMLAEAHATPAAVASPPLTRQQVIDRFGFLEGIVNEANFLRIVDEACALAAAPKAAPAAQEDAARYNALVSEAHENKVRARAFEADAARWRWLSEHIIVAWNDGKFTSLVRIVSDKNRASLNASVDRMMAGDWSDADATRSQAKEGGA